MVKVYIAGPYSASNVIDVLKNIGRGQAYANAVFQLGFAPFCPWFDKEFVISNWDDSHEVGTFFNYSLAWLKVSDCVFIVPNHCGMIKAENSPGTQKEIEVATQLGIPVFYSLSNLLQYFDKDLTPDIVDFKLSLLSFTQLKLL